MGYPSPATFSRGCPMGEAKRRALKVRFDRRLRLEFHLARITSDAGLPACRELDDALGLTVRSPVHLQEIRHGRNFETRAADHLQVGRGRRIRGSVKSHLGVDQPVTPVPGLAILSGVPTTAK